VLAYAIRRIAVSIPVLIGSSILVFLLVKLSGDPLDRLRTRNPPASPRAIALERHRLYLDRSLPGQYWRWLEGLLTRGTFGPSVHAGTDIATYPARSTRRAAAGSGRAARSSPVRWAPTSDAGARTRYRRWSTVARVTRPPATTPRRANSGSPLAGPWLSRRVPF
jgi:hypothetical protein